MARLNDRVALVTDTAFASRVAMAAVSIALEVVLEDPTGVNVPQRQALASAVLADPLSQGARLTAVAVADEEVADLGTQKTLGGTGELALDMAITDRLRDTWNALSGVTG